MIVEIPLDQAPEGLPHNSRYRIYRWEGNGRTVYFSASRQGDGVPIHIYAPTRKDRRGLRRALNEFCEYLFDTYSWCSMVMGVIGPQSVVNLARKCGFDVLQSEEGILDGKYTRVTLVARRRE